MVGAAGVGDGEGSATAVATGGAVSEGVATGVGEGRDFADADASVVELLDASAVGECSGMGTGVVAAPGGSTAFKVGSEEPDGVDDTA